MIKESKKQSVIVLGMAAVFLFMNYAKYAWFRLDDAHLNIFFMSYKNGFVSAGFLGTVWRLLNAALPMEMMSYISVYTFSKAVMIFYDILLLFVCFLVFRKCAAQNETLAAFVIALMMAMCGAMFSTGDTLGSYQMYEACVLLLMTLVLLLQRLEWLIFPLAAVGTCIHPSFLLFGMPLVAGLLYYRFCRTGEKKYRRLLVSSGIVSVCLFILSEVTAFRAAERIGKQEVFHFCRMLSLAPENYDEIHAERAFRSMHVLASEWRFGGKNWPALILFALFFFPYLYWLACFLKEVLTKAPSDTKQSYRVLFLGSIWLLPIFLLKAEYGFAIYAVMIYYFIAILFLIAEEDAYVISRISDGISLIRGKTPLLWVWLVYPLLFMPFSAEKIFVGFEKILYFMGR